MGKITDILTDKLDPIMAIIVYSQKSDNDNLYLEKRAITKGVMGSGSPLQEETISKIAKHFSSKRKDIIHGFIPSNMIYCDPVKEKYIWYRKPEKRMFYFDDELAISDGEIMIPGMIYVVSGDKLSIYAYKGKISEKTKLYRSPFFNVSDTCSVCLGNAKVKKQEEVTYQSTMKYWEDMFWLSKFIHSLGSNSVNGNLSSMYKHCIATGESFPFDKLKLMKLKLGGLLK